MKRSIAKVLLLLGVCQAAWGGLTSYENYGVVTTPPVVDGLSFFNAGEFDVNTFSRSSLTNVNNANLNNIFGYGYTVFPFETKDTLYFTNASSGLMVGAPGFEFVTSTSTAIHSASFVVNEGTIAGLDNDAILYLYSVPGATTWVPVPADSQPIPSQLLVQATNIVNTGAMSVGNCGLLRLTGNNVTNSHASLAAGQVSTSLFGGTLASELSDIVTTGLQGEDEWAPEGGLYFYLNSPFVYDLFWAVTNAVNINLPIDPPNDLPQIIGGGSRTRYFFAPDFPINFGTAQWSVSVFSNNYNLTNVYYNIVFVNTNFGNGNISATVGFAEADFPQDTFTPPAGTPFANAMEAIVQFAEPVYDVISGTTVTNGIYLLDAGANLSSMVLGQNAGSPPGYFRPNAFELTTETPLEWFEVAAFPTNLPYDSSLIYAPGEYMSPTVPFEIAEYGAQIGRNPADLDGTFSSLVSSNTLGSFYLQDEFLVSLPDPTNEAGRIEIDAGNLDISQSRIRAEGMVILNATNLVGGGTAAVDWGEVSASLGATNGALVVSNIFPTTFERVRGDIYAWCADWSNIQTNATPFVPGITNAGVTNNVYVHVLVVDQNLFGSFPSTMRNLSFTGSKSIVLQDNLNAISQAVFNTTNLIVNSANSFSQNAANFTPGNTPYLENLLINTNGIMDAYSTLDVGYNVDQGPVIPTGRTYTVNSITNFGQMFSTAPVLQAANFENDGEIASYNGGSILIEADKLGLGLAAPNTTNYLFADGNIELSAASIEVSNSVIQGGLAVGGLGGSLTLYATSNLTDFVSATNTQPVILNHWTVTDGFSLPVKPAYGDLFGTEIHTISTGAQEVSHVWAGMNLGATPAGFSNNAVIGRLVLDRQSSNSLLRFSAAGADNALYVDYLVLTNYAYTNYRSGLVIDPNFTIYFADSNADPQKLAQIYTNLVWATNFAGPNSTQVIYYQNSSIFCLMNAGVANSPEITFWPNYGRANFYLLNGTPPYTNLLNNPLDGTDFMACPGTYGFACNCQPGSNALSLLLATTNSSTNLVMDLLTISYNGQGTVSPIPAESQLAVGQSPKLTATPAKGWLFENWTIAMLGNVIQSSANPLTFAFVTNTVITANFIPNYFPALQGVFSGLFYETNTVEPESWGAFSLTLAKSGKFSGHLLLGAKTYKFSSQFSSSGSAQFPIKSGALSLTVNLQLDMSNQVGLILGDVTNNDGAWDAVLMAELAPTWTTKSPSPLAGSYTMVLPGTGTLDTPEGDSYGVGTISKLGVLTLAGKLADGASFSVSAPVSQNDQWPFYAYSASGKDTVLGWVTVGNGLGASSISWFKAPGKGSLYPRGFTNVLSLVGSPWQAPAKRTPALTLASPAVILSGDDLAEPLTYTVALKNYLTFAATNVSLSISPASGSFTGWFESPGSKRKQSVSGVVLQNVDSASGFFLGASGSGTVMLQNQYPQ